MKKNLKDKKSLNIAISIRFHHIVSPFFSIRKYFPLFYDDILLNLM